MRHDKRGEEFWGGFFTGVWIGWVFGFAMWVALAVITFFRG